MTESIDIIYLGRNRLHRSRANLIQTLNTVSALKDIGLRTRLYLPPWGGDVKLEAKLREVGVDPKLDVRSSQLLHPRLRFLPFVWTHRKELEAAGHVYTRTGEISIALAKVGITHSLEVHEVGLLKEAGIFEKIVDLQVQGKICHINTTTEADRRRFSEAGADVDRLTTIANGVNLDVFKSVPAFDPNTLDNPRLVYIGRISQNHGLAVFDGLAKHREYTVTLVGSNGDMSVFRPFAIELVPHCEVPGWYARCDIAVMPYQPELSHAVSICPLKLFEAMAAGRPIVISDLPTVREFVEHEKTALLVDPSDTAAWIAAVERLRSDRSLAKRLATNARSAADQYSWCMRARRIAATMHLAAG